MVKSPIPLSNSHVSIVLNNPVIIRIPVIISITHNIFLNDQSALLARRNFLIIALPPYVTNNSTAANHNAYKMTYTVPNMKLCGNIIPSNNAYVGEHVANIGHKDAHKRISPRMVHFCFAFWAKVWLLYNQILCDTFSRIAGQTRVIPYKTIILPDTYHQKLSGIDINAVDAFNTRVNTTIKILAEPIITNGLYRFWSLNDPHIITGNTGSTQGASTVSIHANIANRANIMIIGVMK